MNEIIKKAIKEGILIDTPKGYIVNGIFPISTPIELDKPLISLSDDDPRKNKEVGLDCTPQEKVEN